MDSLEFNFAFGVGVTLLVFGSVMVITINPFVYAQELTCEVVAVQLQNVLSDNSPITRVYYKVGVDTKEIWFYGHQQLEVGAVYHLEYSHNHWGSTFTLDKATRIGE